MTTGSPERIVLAADVGGTNLTLALLAGTPGRVRMLRKAPFATASESDLGAPVARFLRDCADLGPPTAFCVSGAGQVREGRIRLTNAGLDIHGPALEAQLGIPVALVNDFTAVAQGVLLLDPDDGEQLLALPHGEGPGPRPDPEGTVLVVGAGTGLGVGFITRGPGSPRVHPSEGGHIGLPVTGPETLELWEHLGRKYPGPPGAETAVSGPGIATLHRFLLESGRFAPTPASAAILALPEARRPGAIAGEAGDPACRRAMELFVELYARVCAELSAVFIPTGGLFLAGGIASKNAALFLEGRRFTSTFDRNYREHIDHITRATPVHIVRDYDVSLYGAADAALRLGRP
ncbi:glucokinase [Mesoterricola silvestris]|uniref:Glucokinase n=1 Tax=Mesoterricola silvestris TaxID=2927979 RepID=A0AA48GJ11_9BACT|nr:glucokinase [Mesoterricola silvestris]BDU71979.1 glucokinase [Mesoterricola silvestris]